MTHTTHLILTIPEIIAMTKNIISALNALVFAEK